MIKILRHMIGQPFVFATGLAALVHSTWAVGTLFGGQLGSDASLFQQSLWLITAFLIAFSLDVGQIVTSSEIRAGQRTLSKYLTFVTFAVATYYLQWIYIAYHMPQLPLAVGVRAEWQGFARLMFDAALWIIPAFLPLSTTLYTFSHGQAAAPAMQPAAAAQVTTGSEMVAVVKDEIKIEPHTCSDCGRSFGSRNALIAHFGHCAIRAIRLAGQQSFVEVGK